MYLCPICKVWLDFHFYIINKLVVAMNTVIEVYTRKTIKVIWFSHPMIPIYAPDYKGNRH